MYTVKPYESDNGNEPVTEVILELTNQDLQNKVIAAIETLRTYGIEARSQLLKIKKIKGKILELKLSDFRILFAFQPGNIILLLHAFTKKRQKIDPDDIELAEKRLKKYKS